MSGICYRKGHERGLWFEIKCIEECIAIRKELGKDVSFEKKILQSYKKYSEKDYADGLSRREESHSGAIKRK